MSVIKLVKQSVNKIITKYDGYYRTMLSPHMDGHS